MNIGQHHIHKRVISILSKRVIKDSALQFVTNILSAAFGFFQLPILLKLLGGQGFGNLVLFQTVVGIFSTFTSVQFHQGMLKYAPKSINSNAIICRMYRIGLLNEFLSAGFLFALIFLSADYLDEKFIYLTGNGLLIFISVGLSTAISNGQTISIVLRLQGKYQYVIAFGAMCSAARFVLLLISSIYHYDVVWAIFVSFLIPEILRIAGLLLLIPANMLFDKLKPIPNIRQILSFSIFVTIQEWCDLPIKQFDKIILSFFVQPVHVGVYQIMRRIGNLMAMIVIPFSTSFFHEFSERVNIHDLKGAMKLFKISIICFTFVSLALAGTLIITQPYWVPKLFENIVVNANTIILIISIYVIVNGFNSVHSLLFAVGGIKESFFITFVTNIMFFILAIVLASKYQLTGLILAFGIQVATLIGAKIYVIHRKMRLAYSWMQR